MPARLPPDLDGRTVVVTRPPDSAGALARRVRALGGHAVRLPGLSLRRTAPGPARAALVAALAEADVVVFSSPAAVRFAAALAPLATAARVLAVGRGTARGLARQGVRADVPARQDSEGVLAMPALGEPAGRTVAVIGAAGGRGLLQQQLAAAGAAVREVHVYARLPPHLDRRHLAALARLPADALVLLSSAQALAHLQAQLPAPLWQRLSTATAVVSSERLGAAARTAGFGRVCLARSALPADLLAAAAAA